MSRSGAYVAQLMGRSLCGAAYVAQLMWRGLCGAAYVAQLMWPASRSEWRAGVSGEQERVVSRSWCIL